MINWNNYPFKKGSYEYYFDQYFDIPDGIAADKYTDLEADKYAMECLSIKAQAILDYDRNDRK